MREKFNPNEAEDEKFAIDTKNAREKRERGHYEKFGEFVSFRSEIKNPERIEIEETTKLPNGWSMRKAKPFLGTAKDPVVTPQWYLVDPEGEWRKAVFFTGGFSGNKDDFEIALNNFCNRFRKGWRDKGESAWFPVDWLNNFNERGKKNSQ